MKVLTIGWVCFPATQIHSTTSFYNIAPIVPSQTILKRTLTAFLLPFSIPPDHKSIKSPFFHAIAKRTSRHLHQPIRSYQFDGGERPFSRPTSSNDDLTISSSIVSDKSPGRVEAWVVHLRLNICLCCIFYRP